jgi:hypothetical protein
MRASENVYSSIITPKEAWEAVRLLQRGFTDKILVASMKFRRQDGSISESSEEAAEIMANYLKSMFSKEATFDEEAIKRYH